MPEQKVDSKLMLMMGLFASFFVLANLLAVKRVDVGPLTLTLGLLSFPFMFLITDIVNEVYGKATAQKVVKNGFIVMIFTLIVTQIALRLPPSASFHNQEAFAAVFGAVPRITIASLMAYLASQYHDVWAFQFWKGVTGGKHLWLRNNLSTITSQALDSVLFISIAFYGVVPMTVMWSMVLGQWITKWLIAVIDTPLCYLGVAWAREGLETRVPTHRPRRVAKD